MNQVPDFITTLPDRAVIHISGPDARSFLQRVITNGPENLSPGTAQFSALLTPQGKVLADFLIFADGQGGLWFDVPASEAESLLKRFTLYRLRAKAELRLDGEMCVAAARGPDEDALKTVARVASLDPRSRQLGLRAIVPAGTLEPDTERYHLARIAAGVAEMGSDYGPSEVFSTDVNHDLMGGIDYKKGCFVGQEVASRMHRKGGVRKRTVVLTFDGEAPAVGTEVRAGETAVGTISSAAGQRALARVRVDRLEKAVEEGAAVSVDGKPAQLTGIDEITP